MARHWHVRRRRRRSCSCTATALVCVAVAGCGFGAGPSSSGTATLTVTRDYGSKTLVSASEEDPPSSETVIRFLDDEADITTRYGGGFVQSIDGLAGTGPSDWFFYVNGVESPVGSADVHVAGGDRIWWDYRNWSATMSVPAVVGSWPEPFAQASAERPEPVVLQCADVRAACEVATARLASAGVSAHVVHNTGPSDGTLRMLLGTWTNVRDDPAVDALRGGPVNNGVFATFKGSVDSNRWHLIGLDPTGTPVRGFGTTGGLVAALGRAGEPQTWIVTGSSPEAVRRGAAALDGSSLGNRYAIAATRHGAVPLPIVGKAGG